MSGAAAEPAPDGLVDPVTLADFEAIARVRMSAADYELVASHSPGNITMERTRAAWDSLAFRPRVLPGAAGADVGVDVLGRRLEVPFMLAPVGYLTRAHPDGELAAARAASAAGTVMSVAANPGHPFEAIADAADGPKWFQTYLFGDRDETVRRVRVAEESGYAAIILTLDAHWPAKRESRVRRRATSGQGTQPSRPVPATAAGPTGRERHRVLPDPARNWADPRATWEDLAWFRSLTSLPIVAKGIMTGEDAERCVEHGLEGLVVSNHGGRLDNTPATIEVLPEVVATVGARAEVYLDGGIRRGADVVKALALGARAVLLGRPVFWGLAHDGEVGLVMLLDILREEVEMTMMLCSRVTVDSLAPDLVSRLADLPASHARA
jgi:4-hydroxymandelate oxidase